MIEIKNIIASFINKQVEEISEDTVIDKTVIKGSVMIHRMYAVLANKGYSIKNYTSIKTFGELLDVLNFKDNRPETVLAENKVIIKSNFNNNVSIKGIGIDIEKVSNLPISDDFRNDAFYLQNFTQTEISYCILKQDPIESFAGLFCVKEAIFKTGDKSLNGINFNQIEISHSETGAPSLSGYYISLSHTDGIIVAVAIALG